MTLKSLLIALLLSISAFAGDKDQSRYPLEVSIIETHWRDTGYGTQGYGRGNVQDGDSLRGFDYTFQCSGSFNATTGDSLYMARWKKPESRLAILTAEIGNSDKLKECELKVSVVDVIYATRDGHLITYTQQQYEQIRATRKRLTQDMNPADTDPSHFPLGVSILESLWEKNPSGGMSVAGRGNIRNGTSVTSFDFSGVCLTSLKVTTPGTLYLGKWQHEPTDLVVLSRSVSDSKVHQCQLKTQTRPTHVYIRNAATGAVTALTQDEFKVWLQKKKSAESNTGATNSNSTPELATVPAKSKLTNADVISMVSSGLSAEVILAKLNASACDFDTSPDGLRQLKAGKVPDAILVEMIKKPLR